MVRLIVLVLMIFSFVGCATQARKQASLPSSSSAYDRSLNAYPTGPSSLDSGYEDAWVSDGSRKSVQRTAVSAEVLGPKEVQRALKNSGYYSGVIDGKIGPKTKEAIVKFQKAKGLKADGIVGKKTTAALRKYLNR